jgi:hypothetical protein
MAEVQAQLADEQRRAQQLATELAALQSRHHGLEAQAASMSGERGDFSSRWRRAACLRARASGPHLRACSSPLGRRQRCAAGPLPCAALAAADASGTRGACRRLNQVLAEKSELVRQLEGARCDAQARAQQADVADRERDEARQQVGRCRCLPPPPLPLLLPLLLPLPPLLMA